MTRGLGLRRLMGHVGATFVRQLAAALFGLLTIVIIARVYGPAANGAYAVALLLPTLLVSLLNFGVAPANVYYLGTEQAGVRALFVANLVIFLLVGLVGLVIGAALLLWQRQRLFPGIDASALWLALGVYPFALLNSYLHSLLQGLQAFGRYNLLAMVQPAMLLLLVAGLSLGGHRELTGLLGAQLVAQLVALGLTLRWVAEWIRADDRGPGVATCLKRSFGYGWKAHVGNILAFLNYKADVFLANLFLGPAAVGVYVIAVALAEKLWLISQAVSTVLLPRLAQLSRDDAKRKQLTPLIARWLLLITAMAALVLAWLAHTLIDVVFGSEYAAAVLPLWILLPGMVLMAVYRVLANDIAARGRPELNMLVALAVVVVNLAANLILIPWLGLAGAAAATTIAYALSLVMGLKFYRRLSGNDWHDALCLTLDDARWLAHGWRAAKPGSQT